MVYIYFIYGLSFFSFGLAVLLYPRMSNIIKLEEHFWLIGVFGIIHGISEWIDMFVFIEQTKTPVVEMISFVILPLSYLFLLYFGLISISEQKKLSLTRIKFIIITLILLFLVFSFQSNNLYLEGNIWARYLLGIPGIFLTSYVLFMHKDAEGMETFTSAKVYLFILSLSFFFYGIFAGIVVPKAPLLMASIINYASFQEYFGVPVQIFRAFTGVVSAFAAIGLFKLLRHKTEMDMLKLSSAIEYSGDSVVITDGDGIIEYVNPAFEQQTGFTKQEAIGKKPNIIKSGTHTTDFYRNKIWVTILAKDIFRGYIINKKKNGELYHEYKAIAPVIGQKGNISYFVSSGKDVTEHMLLEQKLKEQATTDKLTGIPNRLRFDEVLHYSIDRAKRYKVNLSVILFDIDNFKEVNDTYGHLCGDDVLKMIAKIGDDSIRKSDLIARWGGEEFIILQPDIPSDEAQILAERLRHAIESYNFKDVGKVTASFGVTHFKEDDTKDTLIKRVDDALYEAKEHGRNRVEVK